MSLWRIAWGYLWNRSFTTLLTIFSVALGVGLISAVLTLREETRIRFEEEGQAFDIVVGPNDNGPLQLVLSTTYFLDFPRGTIPLSHHEWLMAQEEEVVAAFPISMGDNYKGYRIVGAPVDLMTYDFEERRESPYQLEEGGRYYEKPMEAVLGAGVAATSKKKVGDTFYSTHGLIDLGGEDLHDTAYTVVGILKRSGTPNDRAIFTSLESVWNAHDHGDEDEAAPEHGDEAAEGAAHDDEDHAEHDHDAEGNCVHDHAQDKKDRQVTAILVKTYSPNQRFSFVRKINSSINAMAVIPIMEVQRLFEQLLGIAKAVLLSIGYLVVVISSLSILIGLYMAIMQRKRDLAIMRALGASKGEIFGSVLIEAFWVTVLGIFVGWFMGGIVCWGLSGFLVERLGFHINAIRMTKDLITAYSAVLLMGMIAGILPAWQAYRSDVARDLAEL